MPNTVPNRPMNGPAEAIVARTRRFEFEPLDLAGDRDVEHLVDARMKAAERAGRLLERALPLPHRGDEQRRRAAVVGLTRERRVKLFKRLARPENRLEVLHLVLEFVKQAGLVENDRPAPERSEEQAQHHRLDDDVGRPEHLEDAGFRSRGRGGYVGWIHRGGNLLLGGEPRGHGGKTGSGRGLRRKSAETGAFAGRRKSLLFSRPIKTLIGLKAGYQVKPPLASGEFLDWLVAVASGAPGARRSLASLPKPRRRLYRDLSRRDPLARRRRG